MPTPKKKPAPKTKRAAETPRRYRDAKTTASAGSIQKRIARDYGLPTAAVQLVKPNGKKANSNKSIGSLKSEWE